MAKRAGLQYNLLIMKPYRLAFLFSFLILLVVSCAPSGSLMEPRSEYVMGTICTINLFEKGSPELYSEVFARLRELEDILSANREGTDLDKVNQNAGQMPVKVRPELIELLGTALVYAERTKGALDPTIGPLVKLWGIGTESAHVPPVDEIRKAQSLIGYHDVEINREAGTVFLKRPGMALDLGSVGKGYAADVIDKLLTAKGVKRAMVDLGGNIFAMGEKAARESPGERIKDLLPGSSGKDKNDDGSYWRVGVQDPRTNRGNYIGILKVKNKTVVTSGVYERFFIEGGKRYHHIFNIETGYPAENGLLSTTIVSDSSTDADALSTATFVLGWERGSELIASVGGAEGIFVSDDLSVRVTPGLGNVFALTAAEYHLANP